MHRHHRVPRRPQRTLADVEYETAHSESLTPNNGDRDVGVPPRPLIVGLEFTVELERVGANPAKTIDPTYGAELPPPPGPFRQDCASLLAAISSNASIARISC